MSSEEAKVRQQPGEVNKCPSVSVLGILVKTICTGLNSFFWALNSAYSFSITQKKFSKKAPSKPQARKFFLCFVVKFINSTVSKDCFSQLKETAQFSYMTWRE